MVSITIENVWKYYGETVAVRDLNLDCKDGEFVCVLGPSGCGKSSTMRMLAGLEHISAGTILFGDRRINDLPPRERDIAMVFENYALYPHKTVFDNMANPLRLAKSNQSDIADKVKKVATMLEIDPLLERKPMELSGGQKQRVAIGRAIVRQPQVFLFDEPIAHLDAKLRARMRGELKHLQRGLGVTTIYVTHDQLEALSMADRIAVMHEGVLQQYDTPAQIYNHPVNAWVASFVGEPAMNLIQCDVRSEGDELKLVHSSFTLAAPEDISSAVRTSGQTSIILGVRPDNLTIGQPNDERSIAGEIFATELLGSNVLVEVTVGQDRLRVRTEPTFRGDIGDPCSVRINGPTHAFTVETGAAISGERYGVADDQ